MPALKSSLYPNGLAKWNVELVDRDEALKDNVILRCGACGAVWTCNSKVGGHLPPGYYKCSNGCNVLETA